MLPKSQFKNCLLLVIVVNMALVDCKEQPNMEDLEDSENWTEVSAEICKKDHSDDVKAKIEKCNELDSYYKFNNLTRQCDKLRAHLGSAYYEDEKGDCRYQECYKKLSHSKEFKEFSKELDSLSEETRIKKGRGRDM
ncbi:unnamed protein product [Oppiella nova]|uniref:Uncharacterized protein n=1 Tax=Oppiella nova TaxID=334625 RepID=A0A7R9LKW5_9ACAR|nr:unnamed protein product [Oppiella nova]CAG2164650.1 unnamed protein product [Oppiella nova]